jgi:hypothetical protein
MTSPAADKFYTKLEKNFDATAAQNIFNELLEKQRIKNSNMMAAAMWRLVVNITTLRQYYPEELGDWGTGGRRLKNEDPNRVSSTNPLSTSMRR